MIESAVFTEHLYGRYWVRLPEAVVIPFMEAGKRRVEVLAWFDGKQIRFHAAIQKRKGSYLLMFSRKHQKSLGIFPNDYFKMQLREDQTEFGAELPPELREAFVQWPEAYKAFLNLTDGAKRSVIYGIARYKSPQLRVDRTLMVCERLCQGVRNPRELFKLS